ncbi:MAG: DUF1841 family protein [Coxiellaceae bacterium]|nr:MAG: DUF1841 family protein [Coxiellaceae bacterium]
MNDPRDHVRRTFCDTWRKHQMKQTLSPLEMQLVAIILQHPEYQPLLENSEKALARDYSLETNPFFHMGMHLTIMEQVSTDRPAGIRQIFQQLVEQTGSNINAEHLMLPCLQENLWQAQRTGMPVSDTDYLAQLQQLVK